MRNKISLILLLMKVDVYFKLLVYAVPLICAFHTLNNIIPTISLPIPLLSSHFKVRKLRHRRLSNLLQLLWLVRQTVYKRSNEIRVEVKYSGIGI